MDTLIGPEEAGRVRLAAGSGTPAAILLRLADDPALTVRAAIVLNHAQDPAIGTHMLRDQDDRVRMLLAGKLAALLPGLSGTEQAAAQRHVHVMIETLAEDAAVRVRVALSEALKALPSAPRGVILTLAHDKEMAVSDPMLRFSPLLTDADLLDLLATPPHPGAATSIATRQGLGAAVADDIASHADSGAVQALLSNGSAFIQEDTLDSLLGRAGDHPEWHEPLVCRPGLPVRAMRALSMLLAGQLLDALANRVDLPPDLAGEVRERIAQELAPPPSEAEVLDHVRQLNANGGLTEVSLLEAAAAGDCRQTAAILAVASGVPLPSIDRAVGLRSAKALVSLVARAGFSMRAGLAVQALLGRLLPGDTLQPAEGGGFPLSGDEMDWQIELLDDLKR